jgi:hypothetical protein
LLVAVVFPALRTVRSTPTSPPETDSETPDDTVLVR